jgi:hypothetical protein
MAKLKKSELVPKSKLGIDFSMKICWNCLFWNPETGRCPMFEDKTKKKIDGIFNYSYFPYNHKCQNIRVFGNRVKPRE